MGQAVRRGCRLTFRSPTPLYQPLVARQVKTAEEFRQAATFNDVLLDAAVAYYDLILATGRSENLRALDIHSRMICSFRRNRFVDAGKGSKADVTRIQTELTERQQLQIDAAARSLYCGCEAGSDSSARSRDLTVCTRRATDRGRYDRTDDACFRTGGYRSADATELGERYARLEAGESALEREQWRPFLPNLSVGASAGAFGGGVGSSVQGLAGRSDFDIAAVWKCEIWVSAMPLARTSSEAVISSRCTRTTRLGTESFPRSRRLITRHNRSESKSSLLTRELRTRSNVRTQQGENSRPGWIAARSFTGGSGRGRRTPESARSRRRLQPGSIPPDASNRRPDPERRVVDSRTRR